MRLGPAVGCLQQKAIEKTLAVGAICPQVSEVPSQLHLLRKIDRWIDRTIENARQGRTEFALHTRKCRPAGKREVELIIRDQVPRNVLTIVLLQFGKRDGRVNVIKRSHTGCMIEYPPSGGNAFGHIGSDHNQVRMADLTGEA